MEFRRQRWVRAILCLSAALPLITAVFVVLALGVIQPTAAAQSIPYKVNFQGRLTDNSGNILADGYYNIKFRLYDALTAGTLKYTEDRIYAGATPGPAPGAFDNRVQVINGLFNIQFGDVTTLSPTLFSGVFPLYLEVEMPTPATATCSAVSCGVYTEGAMTPRQPLASSPYAFNADTLDGADSAAFAQLATANTFTAANLFAPGASAVVALTVKASTAGGVNSLEVFDSANVRQAFFSASGSLNLGQVIQPTTNNVVDLGVVGSAFKSVFAAVYDTGTTTTALTVGATNATSITVGQAAVGASLPGGVTTPQVASGAATTLLVDSGTTGALNVGTGANAKIITIGNSTLATAVNIVAGTGGVNIADDATTKTIDIGGVTNSGTDTVNIATNATAADTINLGNTNAATEVVLNGGPSTTTSGTSGVQIGSASADAVQINLQLDSSNVFAEAASTCTATVNQGAVYYNTSSSALRGCINGSWEDVMTTAGMGVLIYGVVPDSGLNPGDLPALQTSQVTGPCNVSASTTSTTQVIVQPCSAYSGGRKVVVNSATTLTLSGMAGGNIWQHVCFNSSGAIALMPASTETAGFPTWSASNPILCIADVRGTATTNVITAVYDTRTFSTSNKEYTTSAAALPIGALVVSSGNGVATAAATAGLTLRGVTVASSGAASVGNAPSAIISTGGSANVKATAGTANALIQSGATTAGYAVTVAVPAASTLTCTTGIGANCSVNVATAFSANPYAYLGFTRSAFPGTACTAGVAGSPVNCSRSLYTVINLR